MKDYESAAYESVKDLRERHDISILNLRQDILSKYHKFTLSKKVMDIRDLERKHFSVKEYVKAHSLR